MYTRLEYYIHQRYQDIGRADNGTAESESSLAIYYNSKKQQALKAAKTQYKELFKQSVIKGDVPEQVQKLLDQAMATDDLMRNLTKSLGEGLSESLNIEKMADLMKEQITANKIDFRKIMNDKAVVSIKQFNNILQALARASLLIRNRDWGVRLGQYLLNSLHSTKGNTISRVQLGKNLQQQLNKFQREVQGVTLSQTDIGQINNITEQLNALARALGTGKTSKNEPMGPKGMRELVQNIFNTGFAEAISGELVESACIGVGQAMENVKFSGKDQVAIAYTDTQGRYIRQIGKPAYGKADVIFPNISFNLSKAGTGIDKTIKISVGISDKFYLNAKFPGVNEKIENSFSSGSGGKLVNILHMLFGNENRAYYLAFNTIGHGQEIPKAQNALHDIVLTRALVYLFSSRGGSKDFAQYMFINGQIVSIWDIIMSAQENLGLSQSELKKQNRTQPVSISFGNDRSNAIKWTKINEQYSRVVLVNRAINSIKLTGHVNLNALADWQRRYQGKN